MPHRYLAPLALTVLLGLAACTTTGTAVTPTPPGRDTTRQAAAHDDFEPYDEVVPDDAEHDDGLFTVHRLDGGTKVLFEVPEAPVELEPRSLFP